MAILGAGIEVLPLIVASDKTSFVGVDGVCHVHAHGDGGGGRAGGVEEVEGDKERWVS